MILVDTSVWIDHFRANDAVLEGLLDKEQLLLHPFVLGELAIGNLQPRSSILHILGGLLLPEVALHEEVIAMVELHSLYGLGLSYIDVHLLTSAKLTENTELWTRDKRMLHVAEHLEIAMLGRRA